MGLVVRGRLGRKRVKTAFRLVFGVLGHLKLLGGGESRKKKASITSVIMPSWLTQSRLFLGQVIVPINSLIVEKKTTHFMEGEKAGMKGRSDD